MEKSLNLSNAVLQNIIYFSPNITEFYVDNKLLS